MDGLSAPSLLNYFLSGLKEELQTELAVMKPTTLAEAIGLAKLIESKLQSSKPFFSRNPHSPLPPTPPTPTSVLGPPPPPPKPKPPPPYAIKHLTYAEQQGRRAKVFCFNCDERFSPSHQCKSKQLLLLLGPKEDPFLALQAITHPDSNDSTPTLSNSRVDELVDATQAFFHLSQSAFMGLPSSRTLCTQGVIHELAVSLMINSGSSHNIIQPQIAEFLKLQVVAIKSFSVFVGNGQTIQCARACLDVPIMISGHLFHIPFYVLPVHGADVILEVHWLKTLGSFLSNYNVPCIKFTYNNTPITIKGDSLETLPASYSHFCRFLFTDSMDSVHTVTLHVIDAPQSAASDLTTVKLEPSLVELLQQFTRVFETPRGLPPPHSQQHHIHLLPVTAPVNVKPYRYPHA